MIDDKILFQKINIGIATISDSRDETTDKSGKFLKEAIKNKNHHCSSYAIIKDNPQDIIQHIENITKSGIDDVVITTGGTGLTGRDNTIDAVKSIAEIEIPGFGELFRYLSYKKIGTSTIQSRSSAFLVNKKYVFCLPGSTSAVKDAWNEILFYQLDNRHKPCNFIELIPRLNE